jgi:sterol desaturase/sphingolipid hydroxylase (fatty acid hydroxylase superfamily)
MGPLMVAVLISEIVLNLPSMLNHSNIHIPARVDRFVRLFLVTPDMHRIHHSQEPLEYSKNVGFNFPWRDRLLGTYKDQPAMSQESMRIGISGFDERSSVRFHKLLLQPFIEGDG